MRMGKGRDYIGAECIELAPVRCSWSSRLAKAGIILAALVSIAATTHVVLDVTLWRSSSNEARAIARTRGQTTQRIINAATVLQRDSIENIRVLRELARRTGAEGIAAQAALDHIERAIR